jgi:hypothetical protein
VEENLHQPDHAGVVDSDAGEANRPCGEGQRQPLQQRKLDMDVEPLRLKGRKAVGGGEEFRSDRGQMVQSLLQAEVRQVVGTDFVAQESGELLVLFDKGIAAVRPEA